MVGASPRERGQATITGRPRTEGRLEKEKAHPCAGGFNSKAKFAFLEFVNAGIIEEKTRNGILRTIAAAQH